MKIALVTSQVTYIPANYDHLILPLLELDSVALFIELQNREPALLFKAAGLAALGVSGVAKLLASNTIFPTSNKRKSTCFKHHVQFHQLPDMNNMKAVELIKSQHIDLIINLRTRCIYKSEILAAPKLGCINIHHGLLPKYRGTMCDLYALYEGRAAGFSIHKMERRVDAGVIYRVQEVSTQEKDYPHYLSKTNPVELEVLKDFIAEIAQLGHLPQGIPNQSQNGVIHTKNPNRKLIKMMLAKGMKL